MMLQLLFRYGRCLLPMRGMCVKIIMLGSAYLQVNNQVLIICLFLQNRKSVLIQTLITEYVTESFQTGLIIHSFYTLFNCILYRRKMQTSLLTKALHTSLHLL